MGAKHKLSPRQKRACEAFVGEANGEKKKALELAGYPSSVAATKQGREWTADMQAYVRELLDREGITDAFLVKQHKALFKATKPATVKSGADEVTEFIPDNDVRFNATKLGYAVKGILKPDVDTTQIMQIIVQANTQMISQFVPKAKRDAAFEFLERAILTPSAG